MDKLDKQNLEQIAKEKELLQRKDEILDKKISAIQKSTKTSFKLFNSLHNKMRAKWHWYYKWHLSPLSNIFHYLVLVFALCSVSFYGLTNWGEIQHARASSWISVNTGTPRAWSDQCTWVATCDGGTPAAGDSVTIATGTTVTVTDNASVTGITIADSATAILTINTTKTLTASGTVTIGAAGFIQGAGTLALPDGAGVLLSTTGTLNSLVQFTTVATDATGDVIIPARTYGGNVTIVNNTSTNHNATLGTGAGQTINFSGNLNPKTGSTGVLTLKADTNNPTINIVGDYTTNNSSTGYSYLYMGSGTWTLSGNFYNSQSYCQKIISYGTSNLIMNGTGKVIQGSGCNDATRLYDFTISGSVNVSGGSGNIRVAHKLEVQSGAILTLVNQGISLGDGDVSLATVTLNGTINGTTSLRLQGNSGSTLGNTGVLSAPVLFSANCCGGQTRKISARDYYGLVSVDNGWGNNTWTLGTSSSQTINFNAGLTINSASTMTVNAATYNPTINIKGNLTNVTGPLNLSMGSGTWSVYGNVDLTGSTVTAGTSTLDFARMTGTQTFNAGGQTVANVTHSGAGTLQLVTGAASVGDLTLNQTYTKMKTITVDHTKVGATTEDEANFPMLVSLTDTDLRTTGDGGSVTSDSGYDIIFADANGAKLDHEIEKYDAATGEIIMWVRIPLLSRTTDTVITMLYGNSTISTSQENKTNVWMNGYAMVQHLKETSGQHIDSTANVNNSTSVSIATQGTAVGKIDGSDYCNGTNNYISIPSSTVINPDYNQNFTISLWLKVPSSNQPDTRWGVNDIINKPGTSSYPYSIQYYNQTSGGNAGKLKFGKYDGTSIVTFNSSSTVNNDQFTLVNLVRNGTAFTGYLGSTQTGTATDSTNSTTLNLNDLNLCQKSNTTFFMGAIDEVRISNIARSAGWISTEYANQNDPATFYAVSPALNSAGTATAPTIDLNAQALNVGGNFLAAASTTNQTISGTTLTFNSTTAGHTITTNGYILPDMSFSGTGGRWSFSDNPTISGSLTINTGAILDGGTRTITVGDNTGTDSWTNSGTFNYDTSTVDLKGTGNLSGGGESFYNLHAAADAKTTTIGAGNIYIKNVLTLGSTGNFNGGYALWLQGSGNPLVTGGSTINNKIVYGMGAATNIKAANYASGLELRGFNNAVLSLDGDVTASGINFTYASGMTLDTNNHNLTVTGNVDIGAGNNAQTRIFKLTGNGSNTVSIGGNLSILFYSVVGQNNLDLSSFAGTLAVAGNIVNNDTITGGSAIVNVAGSVTNNTGGVTTANSSTWNIGGSVTNNAGATITAGTSTWNVGDDTGTDSWTNSGTFNYDQSLVNLKGTGSIAGSTPQSFYNLHAAANSKTTTQAINDTYIYSVFTVGNGIYTSGGRNLRLMGSGTPFVTSGANITAITIVYGGSSATNIASTTYATLAIGLINSTAILGGDITAGSLSINGGNNQSSILNTDNHNINASSLVVGSLWGRSGTLNLGSGTATITGDVTITAPDSAYSNTINLGSGTLKVGGNYLGGGTLTSGSGTVEFNKTSGGQTVTAGGTDANHAFNNLTITNTHANGVTFADDTTISGTLTATDSNVKKIAVTNGKTLSVENINIEGNHTNRLALVSTTAGQTFNLSDLSGTKTVSYVDVKDSVASSEIVASESKDSGNNTNWMLVKTLTFNITSTTGHVQTPTGATITAKDGTGANTNAVGDGIVLTADNGNITPASLVSSDFTDGTWAGNITLDYVGLITVTATLHGLTPLTDAITLAPGELDHFTITGTPASVIVQSPLVNPVVVTAFDAFGNVKIDYTGQIYFTSTDTEAVLPYTEASKYTFTLLDSGFHSFPGSGFTLKTTGIQTLSATDSDASITETSANITINPAGLGSFTISGIPASTMAGAAFATPANNITVTAKDIFGNVKTDYTGGLWFTSSDSNESIVLPYTTSSRYTYLAEDNGVKEFPGSGFTLITANGTKTISATNGSVTVTSNPITVGPADFHHFNLDDYPQASTSQFATAGYDWSTGGAGGGLNSPYDVVVTAYDGYGNIKTDFVGNVWFTVDGGVTATLPYDSDVNAYTFSSTGIIARTTKANASDNGRHIFDANTFMVATSGSALNFNVHTTGISSTFIIKIKPASIASLSVVFSPILRTKLVDTALVENVTVTALDTSGNVKTDYAGDIYFTSSDPNATLPYTEQQKFTLQELDGGFKTFTPNNTPNNYFTFHTGGNHTLTAVATADSGTVDGNSATFTISAHIPTEIQATAGYQQVTLDWLNPTDPAVSNINIYQSEVEGELGEKIASPNVNAGTYSQYIDSELVNGTPYYYTLSSVVKTPQNVEYESAVSSQFTATPADIAARNVAATQMADGRVKIDYDLRYTSTVSIDYFNPTTATWIAASSGSQTGDIGVGQTGGNDLISHTAYWSAKTDFNGRYYTSAQGFKIRVKVIVPSQGNTTANSPSPSFQLDIKDPGNTTLVVDASGDSIANLSIYATEDGTNAITMMIANEPTFAGKSYQAYATSILNWNLEGKKTVYIKFKDPYSNTTTISTTLVPIIENFMLKDVSDLRVPAYQLFISWGASSISNLQNYIIEYQTNDRSFSELIRTNQTGYVHLNLSKEILYGYRIKIIDTLGNISRPSAVLSSKPGLAPDITSVPLAQVFGYKQDIGVKVIVKWNTDQLADSFVAFSTDEIGNDQNTLTKTGANANIIGQLDRAQAHEVIITNLLPGKKYYMKSLSQNDQKITGYSNVFEIDTPAYIPLQIKGLEISELRTNSAWVSWETNKVSKTTVLLYGEGDKFDKTITDNSLNSDHKFKLEELIPGVEYSLKIEATDEDGNVVNSDEYQFTPPAKPEISGVSVSNIQNNAATITWETNVNTDSNVEYGLENTYGAQSGKSDSTTEHSITLVGLDANTKYHFRTKSSDSFDNEAISNDTVFATIADTTPPALSEIQSQLSQVTSPQGPKYQAVISWKTDEGSSSQVEFGDNAAGKYSKKTQEDSSLNMTHVVILSDMKSNSAYSYRIISKDKTGNEAVSTNYTIITPPQEQSLVQVVIANLQDSFSWVGRLRTKWFKK